ALGSGTEERVDARFLFSTSRHLETEVSASRFRAELLHRIRVVTIDVPALRERPEDLEELVHGFVAEGSPGPPAVEQAAIQRLRELPWQGNVRELRNFLARLRIVSPQQITLEAIDRARFEPKTATIFPRNLLARTELETLKDRLERDYIVYHYRRLQGDTKVLREFL